MLTILSFCTKSWRRVALVTSLILLTTTLVVGTRLAFSRAGAITSAPGERTARPDRRIEAERIVVRRYGFEPAEITRPRGSFLLAVDDRSGAGEIDLILTREGGGQAGRARTSREKYRWREVLDLTPGRYVLTEATHPDWQCHITITAR